MDVPVETIVVLVSNNVRIISYNYFLFIANKPKIMKMILRCGRPRNEVKYLKRQHHNLLQLVDIG